MRVLPDPVAAMTWVIGGVGVAVVIR